MDNNNNLANKRHTLAHILASVIVRKYPEVKLTLGPAIENGWYYDFDFKEIKLTDADLPKIEKKMNPKVERQMLTKSKYIPKAQNKGALTSVPAEI